MENHIEMYVRDGIIRQNILWAVDTLPQYRSAFCRIFCLKRLKRGRGLGIVVGDHLRRGDIMQRIAKFEKVSFEQFKKDWQGEHPQDTEEVIREIYDGIRLPKRATAGSAGYDFFAPAAFTLKAGEMTKILTGIRARIDDGWVLKLYPRSGLGFKFRLQLNNTVGIIDSDYYGSDNEGHIQVKLTNDSREGKTVEVEAGTGFSQGIFVEYGITVDDEADEVRNGGFGSTTRA